jgi:hypothetical protein
VGQPDVNRVQEHDRRACLVGWEPQGGRRPRRDEEVAEVVVVDPPVGRIHRNHAGVSLAGNVVVAYACTLDIEADDSCLGGARTIVLSMTLRSIKDGPSSSTRMAARAVSANLELLTVTCEGTDAG